MPVVNFFVVLKFLIMGDFVSFLFSHLLFMPAMPSGKMYMLPSFRYGQFLGMCRRYNLLDVNFEFKDGIFYKKASKVLLTT